VSEQFLNGTSAQYIGYAVPYCSKKAVLSQGEQRDAAINFVSASRHGVCAYDLTYLQALSVSPTQHQSRLQKSSRSQSNFL